jgi:hypothetical protein
VEQKAAAIQVTGDGHGHREFRNRPFGHRELAPGFLRLKAEGLTPERLTTVAVTRHLELIMPETLLPVSGFPLSGSIVFLADEIPHPRLVYHRCGGTLTVGLVVYSSSDAATIDCSPQ